MDTSLYRHAETDTFKLALSHCDWQLLHRCPTDRCLHNLHTNRQKPHFAGWLLVAVQRRYYITAPGVVYTT